MEKKRKVKVKVILDGTIEEKGENYILKFNPSDLYNCKEVLLFTE